MTEVVALLPMKGHSERLPDKNIRDLAGRPLFFWIADTLRESGACAQLCIDTDSDRIKELARKRYSSDWLVIHDRPAELTGDTVPMNAVIAYDLSLLSGQSAFIQLHSTTPFLKAQTVASAVTEFASATKAGYDSLFCVTEHHSRFYDHNLKPLNHDPRLLERTQDLSPLFEDNSNFYLFTRDSFSREGNRIGTNPRLFSMPAGTYESHDIDTPEEWAHAEMLAHSLPQSAAL